MTKAEWLWVARYVLVIGGSFLVGYSVRGWPDRAPATVTALQPDDCSALGLKPTGWEFQAKYKGGINKGGVSSMITYECR